MRAIDALHKGKFNDMQQEPQPDGSVKITLVDRDKDKAYKLRVRDLYGQNEEEVDYATGKSIA